MSRDEDVSVGDAIIELAKALQKLGVGDAMTSYGAIEAHSMMLKECAQVIDGGLQLIAEALNNVAEAIREGREK